MNHQPVVPDINPEFEMFFAVKLKTIAKAGEHRDRVAERFEKEVKLQFGSAVEVIRLPDTAQVITNPTQGDSQSHVRHSPFGSDAPH